MKKRGFINFLKTSFENFMDQSTEIKQKTKMQQERQKRGIFLGIYIIGLMFLVIFMKAEGIFVDESMLWAIIVGVAILGLIFVGIRFLRLFFE